MWVKRRVAIRDHTAEANMFARRALVAMAGVLIMLAMLVSNLYSLQVDKYSDYQTRADGNRIKVQPVPPNRGLIFDTNGVLLAENTPVYNLEVVAEETTDIDKLVANIEALIPLSADQKKSFFRAIKQNRRRKFKPVTLISRLSQEQAAIIAVNLHKLDGVYVEALLKRRYPYADTLTHALGYVAKINPKDAERIASLGEKANYAATRDIGKLGLEKFYQDTLHGKVGHRKVEVNSRGRAIRELDSQAPIPGQNLHLHLDLSLQQLAKEKLDNKRGAVVMLDASNNGILALYSNPSYNPNLFVHGISSKDYKALLSSKDRPLINRATQGKYPPASTVKPFMAILGLDNDFVTEKTTIWDPGFYQIKGIDHKYRGWKKWGHGHVDIYKAIEESSNTYFYDLVHRMGIDIISENMIGFGYGEATGVDIFEESEANLPSRGWKQARWRQPWYAGDTLAVGIGQGYWTATPLQIALATSVLANEGTFYEPKLLKALEGESGLIDIPAQDRPPVVLNNSENWKIVKQAMYNTLNKENGTAYRAFKGSTYRAAGKTGTAQLISTEQDGEYEKEQVAERLRHNALFVAFAPLEKPQVVIAVMMENAGGGSANAAPVARAMLDAYFVNNPPELVQPIAEQEEP